MAQEIELKLSLPRHCNEQFRQAPLLSEFATAAPQTKTLYNDYFDTPDQQLNRHAVALRIRRQEGRFIQTLKTRGESRGGLHQRHEWEWDLDQPVLDITRFPDGALPASIPLTQLEPAFTTHFERTTWQLAYPHGSGNAEIELVLDEGFARAGERSDPINEIELELKQGAPEALFAFALRLAEAFPLRISRISKGERGYRLHRPERVRQLPPTPAPDAAPHLRALGHLERAQAALEGYEFSTDATLLETGAQALNGLAEALSTDAPSSPETLAALRAEASTLSQIASLPEDAQRQQRARAWLEQQPLGLLLLRVSETLYLAH